MKNRSDKRRYLLVFASLLIGFGCAALLTEGIVRVFFAERIAPRFVIDPGYGVRANQPNVVRTHSVPGDYTTTNSTNSAGMRGTREYTVRKNQNIERILMLGDSFIFGLGVEDDEVVSAVLEDILNAESNNGVTFEVINLAVSGFGQAEELVTYRERGRNYQPDIVVLYYFDNDVGNNAVSKLFEVTEDGILLRTGNIYLPGVKFRELLYSIAPIRWLFTHSQAWNLIRNRLSYLVQHSKLREQGLKSFSDVQVKSITLTKALIYQLIVDIRADDAKPIIVVIPNKNAMSSNFPLERRAVMNAGAELIDGRNYLVKENYYSRDGHWNASGHRKTAEILAQMIRRENVSRNRMKP